MSITNGEEEQITLTKVKLFQPTGFTLAPVNKPYTFLEGIKEFFSYKEISVSILEGKLQLARESTSSLNKPPAIPYNATIEENPEVIIQPKNTYRFDFNLKAGWSGGLRPRPDTYTISGEVEYN